MDNPNMQPEERSRSTGIIIAVIIIIVLIVGIAVWAMTRGGSQTSSTAPLANNDQGTVQGTTTSTLPKTVAVAFTDQGFSPSTVMINPGDTVTFTNSSSQNMWVASDPHPLHTDYPGFDEKSAAAPGESYSFTFEKTGRFGFHNHLTPSVRGTVIVLEPKG